MFVWHKALSSSTRRLTDWYWTVEKCKQNLHRLRGYSAGVNLASGVLSRLVSSNSLGPRSQCQIKLSAGGWCVYVFMHCHWYKKNRARETDAGLNEDYLTLNKDKKPYCVKKKESFSVLVSPLASLKRRLTQRVCTVWMVVTSCCHTHCISSFRGVRYTLQAM